VTPYGVLANLAAMPVVSAVVMPAGMLGLVAMPFGFDGFFWWLMGVGIDWMILVTEWVAALPGAIGRITAFGTGPLIVSSLGIVLLGLLRTPLRWSGAALLLGSVVWAFAVPLPDVLISGDGHNVGVRGRDGRLHLMKTAKDAFLVKEWLAADADDRQVGDASLSDGVSCDDEGCVVQMADGRLIALSLKPEGLADDWSALIVTARPVALTCQATVIEMKRVRAQGAMALRQTQRGFIVEAVKPRGTNRPWSPSAGDFETEAEPAAGATSARPADATPAETDLQPDD
jgi:competence protein ComEC